MSSKSVILLLTAESPVCEYDVIDTKIKTDNIKEKDVLFNAVFIKRKTSFKIISVWNYKIIAIAVNPK